MEKKDVMFVVMALFVILIIAVVIKPLATGQPVNTGLPVPATTTAQTPVPATKLVSLTPVLL